MCCAWTSSTGLGKRMSVLLGPAGAVGAPTYAFSGEARIYVDTADGELKVVFGDGTVKTIVVDT